MSIEEIRRQKSETDWKRLKSSGDFDGEDEDDFEVDWSSFRLVVPKAKKMISLRVDADVLEFFRAQGKGYQTRMNAVLKSYREAMEKA